MSMHLNFEPHSWYMGVAIQKTGIHKNDITNYPYNAYYMDGMKGYIVTFHDKTLKDIKQQIKQWRGNDAAKWARIYKEVQ